MRDTNRTPAAAMRGFGVTVMDFAIECQMDRLAELVGKDPMEFRILNAYRDGDRKAHRRETKGAVLIECVQVAADKAIWSVRDEFRRMSSRQGGCSRVVPAPPPLRPNEPPPPAPPPAAPALGAVRFSSVFGRRR